MSNIRFFFAGDFCSKPSTSRITVSDELKEIIQTCDFKVVNFEVPLKPEGELPQQPRERFFQNDDAPAFLHNLGFNLFPLANNHTFDWGDEGYKKTKDALDDITFGAGTYEEALKVKVVEKNGLKFGFLALSFAAYTGVFDDVDNHNGLGCAYINDLKVNHIIIDAKKNVDYLFILAHDGIEYIDIPMPETIARYHDFIDYGADGVIGTHPHCPQGWEVYKGKPIFYSLGNFFFNSKEDTDYKTDKPYWYEGLCVVLELDTKAQVISYKTVNTRNINNLGIVVEKEKERETHNKQLCLYLINKNEYDRCFKEQMQKIVFTKDLPKMDTTFHDITLKKSLRAITRYALNKVLKRKNKSDHEVQYMLKHDIQRAGLLRVLKQNK